MARKRATTTDATKARKTDAQRVSEIAAKTRKNVAKSTAQMCAMLVKVSGNPDAASDFAKTWKSYDAELAKLATPVPDASQIEATI
jgi:hypothetical protein